MSLFENARRFLLLSNRTEPTFLIGYATMFASIYFRFESCPNYVLEQTVRFINTFFGRTL